MQANKRREGTRLEMPVAVMLEYVGETGEAAHEYTVTENISRRGAAVFSNLALERGRYVLVTSEQYRVSIMAAVRNRRTGMDNRTRLHLQFINKEWPLEGIK